MNNIHLDKSVIDTQNRTGYNGIAPDFNEEERVTTANFHELSVDFFSNVFERDILDGMDVLELGPGRGWLRKNFNWKEVNYKCVDISEEMICLIDEEEKYVSSVSELPFENNYFDVIISSLGDPYFYPEALNEISRVLKHKGKFIFSTPSNEWAKAIRGDNNKTIFRGSKGGQFEVYSFTYDRGCMIDLWEAYGMDPIIIQSVYGSGIKGKISSDIVNTVKTSKKDYHLLEVITTAIFCKR